MKRILITIVSILFLFKSFAGVSVSSQTRVHLFNVGTDEFDYTSVWGHIAIWFSDPVNGIDKIYNYGGAAYGRSFETKFLTGQLRFYLDTRQTYMQEYKTYERFQRDISLYELNLTLQEKQKLYDLLEINALPDNQIYKYELYLKNCSTMTYDIIKASLDGKIIFRDSGSEQTYRKIFDNRLRALQWPNYYIRLIGGASNDKILTTEQEFFLPDLLIENLKSATIESPAGTRNFFLNSRLVQDFPPREIHKNTLKSPLFYFSILLLLEILIFGISYIRKKIYFRFYDYFWFVLMSIVSIVLLFLMFFTDYVLCEYNFNILWANPLFILILLLKDDKKVLVFKIITFCLLLIVPGFIILPQHIYPENMVLAGVLLLKTLKYSFLRFRFLGTQ